MGIEQEDIRSRNRLSWARSFGVSPVDADEAYRMRDEECFYCGGPGGAIDHLVPQSKGGTHDLSNLVPSCRSCNSWKSNRDFEFLYSGVDTKKATREYKRKYYLKNREKILKKYHDNKLLKQ